MAKVPFSMTAQPWLMGIQLQDFRDKTWAVQKYVRYMLDRVNRMFKLTGLPKSMPEYIIKNMLQANGHICVTQVNGDLYGLVGTFGGFPDPYYRGTEYIVANPALDIERHFTPGVDCVIVRNDHMMEGLLPLCNHYASMLVENDLSIVQELIVGRASFIIGAGNDADKLAADDFIRNLATGDLKSVLQNTFTDGIQVNPGAQASSTRLSQLIEANQFIAAKWFNALGLDSNYNMKRESLTANEVDMNSDSLMPLIDDMQAAWTEGWREVDDMFGTSINVEIESSWKDNEEQIHNAEDPQDPEEVKDEPAD